MNQSDKQPVSVADEFDALVKVYNAAPNAYRRLKAQIAMTTLMIDNRAMIASALRLHALLMYPTKDTLDRVCGAYEHNRNARSGFAPAHAVFTTLLEICK